jgi:hypothetical protein
MVFDELFPQKLKRNALIRLQLLVNLGKVRFRPGRQVAFLCGLAWLWWEQKLFQLLVIQGLRQWQPRLAAAAGSRYRCTVLRHPRAICRSLK